MTNFFDKAHRLNRCPHTNLDKPVKRRAVAIVRDWLAGKPFMSPQVRKALTQLIPELREDTRLDDEFPVDYEDDAGAV